MPAYGPATTGPPPTPPNPPVVRRRRRSTGATLIVALGVLARFGGWYAYDELTDNNHATPAVQAPTITPETVAVPTTWDDRVADLAHFVEDEHGGAFEHPVDVEFLSEDEFVAEIKGEGGSGSRREWLRAEAGAGRDDTDPTLALYRALGLVSGQLDVQDEQADLDEVSIIGLYEPDTQRLMVRGTQATVSVKVTVVHELTHAWQDQHYDLNGDDGATPEQRMAWLGLVEGDATRIQDAYLRSLEDRDRRQYLLEMAAFAGQQQGDQTRAEQMSSVPDVLRGNSEFPYLWGEGFAEALAQGDDEARIDAGVRRPARRHAADPVPDQGSSSAPPRCGRAPPAPAGATEVGRGTLGAFDLLLTLGERLGYDRAWDAVRGWGADKYVLTEEGAADLRPPGRRGPHPRRHRDLGTAFADWSATVPGSSGGAAGPAAHLDVCDTGGLWPAAVDDPFPTLLTAEIRGELVGTMQGWLGRAEAECASTGCGRSSATPPSSTRTPTSTATPSTRPPSRRCAAARPSTRASSATTWRSTRTASTSGRTSAAEVSDLSVAGPCPPVAGRPPGHPATPPARPSLGGATDDPEFSPVAQAPRVAPGRRRAG